MIRDAIYAEKENAMGGNGKVLYYHIETEEELLGHARLYAKIVLPPGSSIGYHQHVGETEPYYILSGTGLFTDTDGSVTRVKPGDCCVIKPGDSHGMENDGTENLEFIALIHKD